MVVRGVSSTTRLRFRSEDGTTERDRRRLVALGLRFGFVVGAVAAVLRNPPICEQKLRR